MFQSRAFYHDIQMLERQNVLEMQTAAEMMCVPANAEDMHRKVSQCVWTGHLLFLSLNDLELSNKKFYGICRTFFHNLRHQVLRQAEWISRDA